MEKIGFSLIKLEEINPSIFSDLTKLKLNNFQSNEIKALNQNIFNRLKNLCEIDFSFNQMETIHPEAFVNFISLEVIDLNDNKLKNIDTVKVSFLARDCERTVPMYISMIVMKNCKKFTRARSRAMNETFAL